MGYIEKRKICGYILDIKHCRRKGLRVKRIAKYELKIICRNGNVFGRKCFDMDEN